MGTFKIDEELDSHEWNIDELPKVPTPILAECKVCGLKLRAYTDRLDYTHDSYSPPPEEHVAIPIGWKQLDCSYCQKTIMIDIVIGS